MSDQQTHTHITPELLRAARRGQPPYQDLAMILLVALADLCPECRAVIDGAGEAELPLHAFERILTTKLETHETLDDYHADLDAAPALLDQLRDLTAEQRILLVQNAPERFANLALVDEVLDLSRDCLPADPAGSLGWARTAEALVAIHPEPYDPHTVRTLALQGNAHRAAGDFATATELLYRARGVMREREVVDLDLAGEVHSFFASLHCDRGRFEEAAEHLEQAATIFEALRDDLALARVQIKRGVLAALRGDQDAARAADRAAIGLLSPHTEPELFYAARLNLAFHLEEAGDMRSARELLEADAPQHARHGNAHTRVRVEWLRARLAVHRGETGRAERIYRRLRDHFAGERHGFNAALVCLELAALHQEQAALAELEETAAQALELFRANASHEESLTALAMLHRAAVDRTLNGGAIRRTIRILETAARHRHVDGLP